MTFFVSIAVLTASGLAILWLLRLETRGWVTDVGLAWLVGSGWFAAAASFLRFVAGLSMTGFNAALIALAPVAVWAILRQRLARAAPTDNGDARTPDEQSAAPRWLPRPLRLYLPLAAYVAIVTVTVLLHGASTPTHTDDAVRVRAFAPMLAFEDAWSPNARAIFVMAGPLPTFVPALGWLVGGTVDLFHPNYLVLADLVALLLLSVGLGSARGSPERGWAGAFALLSIPLFVYHCTSTYSDAVLAMRVGTGVLLAIEYARTGAHRDAARAFLLLGIAALVKREGVLVAAAPLAVLTAQLAVERLRGRAFPWWVLACAAAPIALGAIGNAAAHGIGSAVPMLGWVVARTGLSSAPAATSAPGMRAAAAAFFFDDALFRSGNAGMLYWVLPLAIAVRARALKRARLLWPLAAVGALLAEVAISSIVLVPQFTLDQGTVHRALLVASVPAALWLAATLTDAATELQDGAERRQERGAESTPSKKRQGKHPKRQDGPKRGAEAGSRSKRRKRRKRKKTS